MLLKITKFAFLLLVFSLPIANFIYLPIYGQKVLISDFTFLVFVFLFFLCFVFNKIKLKSSWLYLPLVLYFAALLLATLFSIDQAKSAVKLAGEFYLIGLSIVAFNIVESLKDIRRIVLVWLCAALFVSFISLISFLLFYADRSNLLLTITLSHYGTLPAGNYPRIQSLFMNPNMFCHYLTISWVLLALAQKMRWVKNWLFYLCIAFFGFASIFTISPNIGGVCLALGVFYWQVLRHTEKQTRARLMMAACSFIALLFFVSAVVYPAKVSDGGSDYLTVRPSIRYEAWENSLETFSQYPIFGKGLDTNVAQTSYTLPSGRGIYITDAHQIWLNVAAQSGVLGLAALLFLFVWLTRKSWPTNFSTDLSVVRSSLLIALIVTVFYEGLFGSYENARHLWVLIGLLAVTLQDNLFGESESSAD